MPPTPSASYEAAELNRTLAALKESKTTLCVKLNLVRSPAGSYPTYLSRFNALED